MGPGRVCYVVVEVRGPDGRRVQPPAARGCPLLWSMNQVVWVMSRVSEVLHNLDQLTLCVSLIKQTGAYHRRFNGFKPQYFKYFSDPFLGLVHNCLGKEYNSEMRKVYQSVADFLIQTLTEGYNGDVLVAA